MRCNRKRHCPADVVATLGQADEALTKGTPIAEVAMSLGVSEATHTAGGASAAQWTTAHLSDSSNSRRRTPD
jgi:hypothetical protein